MIAEIGKINNSLGVEIRFTRKSAVEHIPLFEKIDLYLDAYCNFYNISVEKVNAAIMKFKRRYIEDIKNFIKNRKYPFEIDTKDFDLSRVEYDLFLISSMLFTRHRFNIAKELQQLKLKGKHGAIIGIGSGIELALIGDNIDQFSAYDIEISDFVKNNYPDVKFFNKGFTCEPKGYDIILAIDTIEHDQHPFELIRDSYQSLRGNGLFIVTMAKNVPQFDHYYNFISEEDTERKIADTGFSIEYKKNIPHNYYLYSHLYKIDACNLLYILRRQ